MPARKRNGIELFSREIDLAINDELPQERERELVAAFQNGDEAAGEELLRIFDPFIRGMAANFWKRASRFFDLDDYIAEAQIGFIIGTRKFDPSRTNRLGAYVQYWMRLKLGEMRQGRTVIWIPNGAYNRNKSNGDIASKLGSLDFLKRGYRETYADMLEDRPDGSHNALDAKLVVDGALSILGKQDEKVIRGVMAGLSQAEAARQLGCSRQNVEQSRNRSLTRMKRILEIHYPSAKNI